MDTYRLTVSFSSSLGFVFATENIFSLVAYAFIAASVLMLLFIGSNIILDPYGLFMQVKGRKIKVHYNERVSKFLLAHRYIPENFDTVILGTSLSANLEVSEYNRKGFLKIYNASIMGADLSHISPIIQVLIDRGIKNIILCLTPYMIKQFRSPLFHALLDFKNLAATIAVRTIRSFNLMPGKFPKDQIDEFGVNRYSTLFKVNDIKVKIAEVIEDNKNKRITVNPVYLDNLKYLIGLMNDYRINYLIYIHPLPSEIFESKRHEYLNFHDITSRLVSKNRFIDFNSQENSFFTSDHTNYIDHGHLSLKGQAKVTDVLIRKMEALATRSQASVVDPSREDLKPVG
jgi:hypothetical protein